MANHTVKTRKEIHELLKQAVTNDKGWSLQGFGMFRYYLSKEWRLHVWDDRFRNPEGTRLHDHPWDFESFVIAGSITNHVFSWDSYGSLSSTHHEYVIQCGPGGCDTGAQPKSVRLSRVSSHRYLSGESYSQLAHEIHDTEYERGTITLVRRVFKEDTEHARVYAEWGQPWVSNEPRQADPIELRAALSTALLRLVAEGL